MVSNSVIVVVSNSITGGGSRGYRAYLLIRSDFSDIVHDYIVVYMFTTSDICAI